MDYNEFTDMLKELGDEEKDKVIAFLKDCEDCANSVHIPQPVAVNSRVTSDIELKSP